MTVPTHDTQPGTDGATVDDLALAAAGVLCQNQSGQTLLVTLTYDRYHPYAVPGGGTEPGETPRATAVRELGEELGLTGIELSELACVDYVLGRDRPPVIAYLYRTARPLTEQQIGRIRLQPTEISGFAFHTPAECTRLLPPRLGRRVAACHAATAGPVALVAGRPLDPTVTAADLIAFERAKTSPRSVPPDGVVLPMDRATYIATRPRARVRAEVLATRADGFVLLDRTGDGLGLPGAPVPVRTELPQQTAARLPGPLAEPMVMRAVDWCTAPDGSAPTVVHLFDAGTRPATQQVGTWAPVTALDDLLPPAAAARVRSALAARTHAAFAELVDGHPPAEGSVTP
ncbi:NUDIX domain-containing protein [Streptacidiphilus sp. MAP5-52]|uniref:NUDIX domain-containing protein n=1 Tax=Streptacidiphilus sp. MAP5-52 TaxID=3156267 RepID=UPI00351107F2